MRESKRVILLTKNIYIYTHKIKFAPKHTYLFIYSTVLFKKFKQ